MDSLAGRMGLVDSWTNGLIGWAHGTGGLMDSLAGCMGLVNNEAWNG